jgi:hypothetical protein
MEKTTNWAIQNSMTKSWDACDQPSPITEQKRGETSCLSTEAGQRIPGAAKVPIRSYQPCRCAL